ncbi:MAG: ABC transporter ATP-binding protein [Actinomycetota bacterium]
MGASGPAIDDLRRRGWAVLRRMLSDHRRTLAVGVLGGLLWQAAGVVVPVVIGIVIDDGIIAEDLSVVWWGVAVIVAAGVLEAIGTGVRHRSACVADERGKETLRNELLAVSLADDPDAATGLAPGELLGRATGDVEELGDFLDSISHTVAHAVTVPIVLVVLVLIDWPSALAVAVLMPILAWAMWRYSAAWERRSAEVRAAFDSTTTAAEELVEGFRVSAGLGIGDEMARRCADRSEVLRAASVRRARLWLLFSPLVEGVSLVAPTVVIGVGGLRVIDGELRIGELVTAVGLSLFLMGPVGRLGERVVTVKMALASAIRVVELTGPRAAPADDAVGDDEAGVRRPVDIEVDGLRVERDGHPVIDGVSVRAVPDSVVRLSGEVGSGKTTLLVALAGDAPISGGRILLGGLDADDWPVAARRRTVMRVGPEPFLFTGSVADNLRFGAPDAAEDDLREALATADALEFVDRLPDGLDQVVGERGITLSGGQRQRLGLARALVAAPEVLLLDGATSAVDPERERRILGAISRGVTGRIVVVVTNHPDVDDLVDVEWRLPLRVAGRA